jgi:hypothetical protein
MDAIKSRRAAVLALPADSRRELITKLSPDVKPLLDRMVVVPLPNVSKRDDRGFIRGFLRQLAGVGGVKAPWMWMVRGRLISNNTDMQR